MASTARRKALAATVATASLLAVVTASCAGSEAMTCADSVLVDWNNGRLGGTYAPECYRDALETLPEDVRLYTTAPEDIKRALRASLAANATRPESAKESGWGQAADAAGRAPRRLSGRQRERKPAPARAETQTRAAPAPGALTAPTSLPLPVALAVTLILVVGAGGVTRAAARRRHVRRLARRRADPPV